jgi:hypothetical protein
MHKQLLALLLATLAFLASAAVAEEADAGTNGEARLAKKLLRASEGVQLPGSESDTVFEFVSVGGEEELPTVERFAEISGCDYPEGGVSRFDFDATFDRYEQVAPLGGYDVHDYRQLRRTFERSYDDLAVYRCETGGPENHIYFLGANDEGVSGLRSVSIET